MSIEGTRRADDALTHSRHEEAIARLGILDRVGDPSLTALTRLAAYITGAPGAAIHILDDSLQHRVAATNLPLVDHPREDPFCRLVVDGEQVARLEDLAEQAVTQIELTRVAVELGELAAHDPLTGAVNRLVLGDRLAQAFARRRRHGGETFLADCGELRERIATALAPPFGIAGDETLDVHVSVDGVLAAPGESQRALIARADAAMYARKQRVHV